MTREEQLENILRAVLRLVEDAEVIDRHDERVTRALLPIELGWRVLEAAALARIEGRPSG